MYFYKTYNIFINILAFILLCNINLFSQVNQEEFGKNRVQYHDDFDQWLIYETDLFTVNWYGKSRNTGQKIVRLAEKEFNDIIKTIDFKTNEKTEFLVFADITDLKQSNIGISDAFEYQEDLTKTIDNKVFITFDGNHNHLKKQIREGIAAVYLNNLLFGSNLQEIVQNSLMLSLPQWFKDGLISYFGEDWNDKLDLRVANTLSNKKIKTFEQLANANPRLAGHMFWRYIDLNYGKNSIGNLVYATRINHNLDKGFQYVLGSSYDKIILNVFNYYKSELQNNSIEITNSIQALTHFTKLKNKETPLRITQSPDGRSLLLVSTQMGKARIRLIDLTTGKSKVLLKYGVKNKIQPPDPNYPCVTWDDKGENILICYEKRDKIYLREYHVSSGESKTQLIPGRYQRIYQIAYWDSRNIIINGTTDGYGNLFLYRLSTRQSTPITSDPFDKLDMMVDKSGDNPTIYFASNRRDTSLLPVNGDSILPIGTFDIFSLKQDVTQNGTEGWIMSRHTSTDKYNETQPQLDKEGNLYFISDEFRNNAIVKISLNKLYDGQQINCEIYNLPLSILAFSLHNNNENPHLIVYDGKEVRLGTSTNAAWQNSANNLNRSTEKFDFEIEPNESDKYSKTKEEENKPTKLPLDEAIPEGKKFITKYGEMQFAQKPTEKIELKPNEPRISGFNKMTPLNPLNIVPYRLKFKITDAGVNFDNSMLFEGLNTYVGEGQGNLFPPFGLLLKAQLRDIFEDYRLEGGIRIPISLNGNEAYVVFDDLKYRLDKRISVYRKATNDRSNNGGIAPIIQKNIILMGQYDLKYAIDQFNAVKVGFTLRQDKVFYKATEPNSAKQPIESTERIGIRATYIVDNTLDKGLNLYSGTRAKAFFEWVKKFDLNIDQGLSFQFNKGHMMVAGIDARNYIELDRHTIFATRLASQVSFGSEKILYYLGGTDGWLFPGFNNETQTATNENYAYQVPTPNLRGFQYNIRNGNNFALLNAELRVPFVRYMSKGTISSTFLNNLQLVGFFDVGTAWNGWNPFAKYNPLNTVFISQPGIDIKVNYFRNPIVFGYGGGLRFLLFGYFVRLDYAKGWDTGNIGKPKIYVSLGTDF